jgi:hypothetical protein
MHLQDVMGDCVHRGGLEAPMDDMGHVCTDYFEWSVRPYSQRARSEAHRWRFQLGRGLHARSLTFTLPQLAE